MSLKLAWAGPWNARSAIAAFGSDIVTALIALGHTVEVFRTETGESAALPPLPAPGTVHAPGTVTAELRAGFYDALFVNFGDHFGYHGAALSFLETVPAVALLHDAHMEGFRDGWRYLTPDGSGPYAPYLAAPSADEDTVLSRLASRSTGAVVHADHYRRVVEIACPGPVASIPLAMSFAGVCTDLPAPPTGKRFTVATIGHVNANKRADQVIRAIAASPWLRERVHYLLIGPVEDSQRENLTALAKQIGAPPPDFVGQVSDEVLSILLAGVNAVSCLRHPVLEGGSASLILALRSGRPTLVSNHGSYADIPDGLVMKCPPGEEAAHVLFHLETILDDPGIARAMGNQAKAYAADVHAPDAYAKQLILLAKKAATAAPEILARRTIRERLRKLGLRADPVSALKAARGLSELSVGAALISKPLGDSLASAPN